VFILDVGAAIVMGCSEDGAEVMDGDEEWW
jgi:hypothetical protein